LSFQSCFHKPLSPKLFKAGFSLTFDGKTGFSQIFETGKKNKTGVEIQSGEFLEQEQG